LLAAVNFSAIAVIDLRLRAGRARHFDVKAGIG
jgi:hypothetical protein